MIETSPQPDPALDPSPGLPRRSQPAKSEKSWKSRKSRTFSIFELLSKNVPSTSLCHLETPVRVENIVFWWFWSSQMIKNNVPNSNWDLQVTQGCTGNIFRQPFENWKFPIFSWFFVFFIYSVLFQCGSLLDLGVSDPLGSSQIIKNNVFNANWSLSGTGMYWEHF